MKHLLFLSAFVLTLNVASAAKFESIYLSNDMQDCVNSMQLTHSHLTPRIKEDEFLGAFNYWKNPFRNIDRSMRIGQPKGRCVEQYLDYREDALILLNTTGRIPVYGNASRLGYFLRQNEFIYGGK